MPQSVSAEDLERYLRILTKKVLDSNPDLHQQPGLLDHIVNETTSVLRFKEKTSKSVLTKEKITDPEFIRHITQVIVTEAVMNGSEDQKKFLQELMQAINEIKANGSYQNEVRSMIQEQESLLKDLQDLMNELDELMTINPELLDKIQSKLHKKLQNRLHKKLLKKLEKLLAMKINPKNMAAMRDALRKLMNEIIFHLEALKKNKNADKTLRPIKEDLYINLFGLLNSYIAGAIAVPLTQYLGNGLGFNDWNPFHGYANIDKINEINFMFQDPMGMEAKTLQNFVAMDDEEVNMMISLLHEAGFEIELPLKKENPFDVSKGPSHNH
jgi:hypothetical protein